MTTYNTRNKLGSTDPRDLYDNAGNFDMAMNNHRSDYWTDRFGVKRQTWLGVERSEDIKGFATLSDLIATQGETVGQLAQVTNDNVNNGVYRWDGSEWIMAEN